MEPDLGTREASDGLELATRRWLVDDPKASVVLVHGLAEYSGRYDHVGAALAADGYSVFATDLRGFGGSQGRRAYVESFDTYVADLAGDMTAAWEVGAPTVLLGHSMGALIALLYATSTELPPDLMVLSAPAIDANIPRSKLLIAKSLVRILPRLEIANGLRGEQLSRDPAVGERYESDPLMHHKSTLRLGIALLDAMAEGRDRMRMLTVPTLVIHSGDDSIVPPRISEPFEELDAATRVVFEGFRHESFNEGGGRRAIETVTRWVSAQL